MKWEFNKAHIADSIKAIRDIPIESVHLIEPILWFTKPYKIGGTIANNVLQHGIGAYNERSITEYGNIPENILKRKFLAKESGLHPTQKPVLLMLNTC